MHTLCMCVSKSFLFCHLRESSLMRPQKISFYCHFVFIFVCGCWCFFWAIGLDEMRQEGLHDDQDEAKETNEFSLRYPSVGGCPARLCSKLSEDPETQFYSLFIVL